MKKSGIVIAIILTLSLSSCSQKLNIDKTHIMDTSTIENISMYYDKEVEGTISGIFLESGNSSHFYKDWKNVSNPSYFPEVSYLNNKKFIATPLITGYGTGILQSDLHIITTYDFKEILYSNPIEYIDKEITSEINGLDITISSKTQVWNLSILARESTQMFDKISYSGQVKYYVENDILYSTAGVSVSPSKIIGEFLIEYAFDGNKYIAKTVKFVDFDNSPKNKVYENQDFGFSIEFPPDWENLYEIEEYSDEKHSMITVFHKATHEEDKDIGILFELGRWKGDFTETDPPIRAGNGTILAKSDGYTYFFHTTSGVEYNEQPDSTSAKEYKILYDELEFIKKSFLLISQKTK